MAAFGYAHLNEHINYKETTHALLCSWYVCAAFTFVILCLELDRSNCWGKKDRSLFVDLGMVVQTLSGRVLGMKSCYHFSW